MSAYMERVPGEITHGARHAPLFALDALASWLLIPLGALLAGVALLLVVFLLGMRARSPFVLTAVRALAGSSTRAS